MVKINNVFGDRMDGKVDEIAIYSSWKGRNYRRRYVEPNNPDTPGQQRIKGFVTSANVLWKTFTPLMKSVYDFLVTKLNISGFNLFSRRYIHQSDIGGTLPIAPKCGQKTLGIHNTYTYVPNCSVENATSGSLFGYIPLNKVITYDERTPTGADLGFLQNGAVVTGCKGFVCERNGTILLVTSITGGKKLFVSYEVNGRVITNEDLGTPSALDFVHLKYRNIKQGSVKVYEGTDIIPQETELNYFAFEADGNFKWYVTDGVTNTNAGALVKTTCLTPLPGVKIVSEKETTGNVTFRAYTSEYGRADVAYTVFDQHYITEISVTGYMTIKSEGDSVEWAAKNETIYLVTWAEVP